MSCRGTPPGQWALDACMAFSVSHRGLQPLPPGTEPQYAGRAILANTPGERACVTWCLAWRDCGGSLVQRLDSTPLLHFCLPLLLLHRLLELPALPGPGHQADDAERAVASGRAQWTAVPAAHQQAVRPHTKRHIEGCTWNRGRGERLQESGMAKVGKLVAQARACHQAAGIALLSVPPGCCPDVPLILCVAGRTQLWRVQCSRDGVLVPCAHVAPLLP